MRTLELLAPTADVQRRTLRLSVEHPAAAKRALALAAIVGLSTVLHAQDVLSPNRRFAARLRPAGAPTEIEVVDFEKGGRPVASSVWKAKGLDLGSSDVFHVTDDGKAVVAITNKGTASQPLVRIVREGKLLVALGAQDLSLPTSILDGWLMPSVPNVRERGSSLALDLLARDEDVRSIGLASGSVRLRSDEAELGPLRVDPSAEAGAGETPYVSSWLAPAVLVAGNPLRVRVRGNLPTPAHRLAGFTLERSASDPRLIVLSPRMQAPAPGTIAPQVLEPFDATATLLGLEPGSHRLTISVRGGEPRPEVRELRVLPAGIECRLEISGGIAGVQRSIGLFESGRVVSTESASGPRVVLLASNAQRDAVGGILERLPSEPEKRLRSAGDDMFSYDLAWTIPDETGLGVAQRDDQNLEPELRELVEAMEKLAREARPTPRYSIDTVKSLVDVKTGSTGLLSAFGHDHKIMVRRLSGTVEVDPSDFAAATVVLEIEAGSLAVVDDDSAKDRVEIEKEMNEHVLEVAKHPTIRFEGRKVDVTPTVEGAYDVVVQGDLSLHGNVRRIRVPGRLELRPGSLRFRGAISLLQSDFGIEPTSAAAGTVNVADKVRIGFDVTAALETPRKR